MLDEKKLSIIYGDEVVDFEVLESPSRTEKILIKVYADCRVVVSTPLNTGWCFKKYAAYFNTTI